MKKNFELVVVCLFILLVGAAVRGQQPPVESFFPILGNYANKSVPLGGSSTISPDTGASGIGTATVSVSGNFKGSVTVAPSSGAVRVLNASPAGAYTVTVRASDFAGFSVTRSFTLIVTNVSSCNTLDFTGIRTNVGMGAGGPVAADFNGDGRQDTATVNNGSSNISVLLGNGNGGFGTVTNFSLADGAFSPNAIAVGDFNGDNKPDLAVGSTNGSVRQMSVFIGTGTGSFAAPVNYSLGGNFFANSLAVGDFNGDGRSDIATGNNAAGATVSILLRNAANNGFDAVTNLNLGFTTNSIAVADFNADGRHDLVVTRNVSNMVVALIRNAANNGFDQVSLTVGSQANQVVIGDFTGDGRQDIAVSYSGGLDVLPRNTLGFDAAVPAGSSIGGALQVGDFSGDGRLDIASVSGNQILILYRNAANTNFDPAVNVGGTAFQLNGLAAADFTGDGRFDLAVLNFVSGAPGSVSVLRRNAANTSFDLSPVQTLGSTNFSEPALGDFDNDGRQDLAITTSGMSNVAIYKGSAGGGFANSTTAVLNNGNFLSGSIAAADFSGDGNTDLIVGNSSINGFSLLAGAGNGSFSAALDFPGGFLPQRFAVGDFNGDGRQDFAVNRQSPAQTVIYLRNAANNGFETPVSIAQNAFGFSLTAGDFNNDGRDDLASGFNSAPGFSVILRNAANSGFDAPVIYAGSNSNGQLTAADFDGDGNLDIAYGAGDVSVYYGSATGTFGAPTAYGGGISANYTESGDFNGDGRQDIVTSTPNFSYNGLRSNLAVLLRNAANDGFDAPVGFNGSYIINNSFPQRILVGEINGDGRQDLLTSNGSGGAIQANFSVMARVCAVDLNLLGALPNGTAGQSYSKTIFASGGLAPYDFTVSGLPAGLNYSTTADSLTIFGTPSAGGRFDVSIAISDSAPLGGLSKKSLAPQAANSLTQILPLQIAFAPTAANVSVSGRVVTTNGSGIRNALVTLTDTSGRAFTKRTNSFGHFRFDEIPVGETYVISVDSKRLRFDPSSRILTVTNELTDVIFIANE
jgi:hypothetical protein